MSLLPVVVARMAPRRQLWCMLATRSGWHTAQGRKPFVSVIHRLSASSCHHGAGLTGKSAPYLLAKLQDVLTDRALRGVWVT